MGRQKQTNTGRLYEEKYNNQGCLMKIVEYNDSSDVVVEFQDEYKYQLHTQYGNFKKGTLKNPYGKNIYNIGMTGYKYPISINCKNTKEYDTWIHVLQRCFDDKLKQKQPTYNNVMCCDEWLNYENFYEWAHSQDNFDKWINGYRWALDKDIIIKRNKIYSPETCCLIPQNVNCLFLKRKASRGNLPIGVRQYDDKFQAVCGNPFTCKSDYLGCYETPEEAFNVYKLHRENYIKQVAEIEYKEGNIIKPCYEAMMNYVIEIDD